MCYLIDTNCLIELKNNFPTDVFVGLWDDIDNFILQEELVTIEEVHSELKNKTQNDFWSNIHIKNGNKFFKELNGEEQNFSRIEELSIFDKVILKNNEEWSLKSEWSFGKSVADPFLICYSLAHDTTIVTQESQRSQLNIPHVCKELNIECINLNQYFKQNRLRYS